MLPLPRLLRLSRLLLMTASEMFSPVGPFSGSPFLKEKSLHVADDALQVTSIAVATSEGLWISFSATLFVSFSFKYSADNSMLLIFSFTFLPCCLDDMNHCLGSCSGYFPRFFVIVVHIPLDPSLVVTLSEIRIVERSRCLPLVYEVIIVVVVLIMVLVVSGWHRLSCNSYAMDSIVGVAHLKKSSAGAVGTVEFPLRLRRLCSWSHAAVGYGRRLLSPGTLTHLERTSIRGVGAALTSLPRKTVTLTDPRPFIHSMILNSTISPSPTLHLMFCLLPLVIQKIGSKR